ncbi:MAG: hypothetical protein FWF28_06525 [Micrococcales bacterium]|nr:hypothetical protein [Micrococcales bacterium]
MSINWGALLLVTIVALIATVVIVSLGAFAARLLDSGHARKAQGQQSGMAMVLGAYGLWGVIGLIILYALYLMIPYFH